MSRKPRFAEQIKAQMEDEARAILRNTRIDLDAFLALKGAARAARWRELDVTAKADLVIQQLRRAGVEWDDALVELWVEKYDERWGSAPVSDLPIPSAVAIADAAAEQAALATRHGDHSGAGQLHRVRLNVLSGARIRWHLGELLISSLNTPSAVYAVSRRGCSCPNGRAGKTSCWHLALYDLLLDVRDQQSSEADLVARIAAARAQSRYAA